MGEQINAMVAAALVVGVSLTVSVNTLFFRAQEPVAVAEGGYVNHPDDLGGETNLGITLKTARQFGYTGRMDTLSVDLANAILYQKFWKSMQLDSIANAQDTTYYEVAARMYKFGMNAGSARSIRNFQRCLNVMNQKETKYADIAVDGRVGPKTNRAFRAYRKTFGTEGVKPLRVCFDGLSVNHYVRISEYREANESFTRGWFVQRFQ